MTNSPAVLLGKLRISSAPRELPHIPLEVAQQIARYLDHRSAFALTLTCRSLREAGETSLYESIDLTSGWGNDNGDNDPSDAGMREDTLHACQRSVASRIRAFEHAISCYAYRKDCMKVFRVEPSGGALDPNRSNARLLQLISMFSKQLVRLDIVSLPSVRSSTPAQSPSRSRAGFTTYTGSANIVDHFGFYNGLCRPRTSSTEVTFPRLKILRMCIPSSVDRMIPYVLKYFTNAQAPLRELHLAATSHAWTSSELTRRSPANFREIATPTLPHLEHLTIYEPARDSRGDLLLACLLKSAPNLGSVRIKEATVPLYSYNEYKPTRALKELVCLPADHTYNLSRCSGLEKHVEDMVVQYTSLSESEEVAQLSLPILPTARRITVLTSYRPDLSEYAQAGSGSAPTYKGKPYPVCASPLYLFESIEAMPHLETIMLAYEDQPCPGLYQADYTDCDFFIPSTEWERKGCRGLVIRQYRNHANTEQTFIHVRSLTRVVDAFECPTYMAFRRFWCDYASFGGQQVDRKTLEKVYKLGGMERGWSTGGRELEMPDAAWEVLQAAISRDEEASMMEDAGFDEYEQDGEVCKWVTGSEPWAVL